MAGGSVTVAALRHRPRQSLLLVGLAAVVTAAAALGPLYARAVEQSVVRTVVADAPVATTGVTAVSNGEDPPSPGRLAAIARSTLPAAFGRPVRGADVRVAVAPPGLAGSAGRGRLVARSGLCGHLEVTDGRCLRGADEVLVSRRTADATGLAVGDRVQVRPESGADEATARAVTVVGVYDALALDDPYWAARGYAGARLSRPARSTGGDGAATQVDDLLTTWSTVGADRWQGLRTYVDVPVRATALDLDTLPTAVAATRRLADRVETVGSTATSGLPAVLEATESQRTQARQVIPLVTVQLALLGVVVLAFVAAAATEARRPEIALARLRGHGTTGAAGLLLRELGPLVLLGSALGALLAWAVAVSARTAWLAPGVPLEARWPVAAAVAGAAGAGLLAVLVTATPTLRQPLVALLRRVPPRVSSLQVGAVEGGLAALAAAGLVTLLSGERGPVALLAPGLLALAGGLLLAQAVIPTAAPVADAALRRGRVPAALAGLQVARRPALRRLIAIVTVACGLLVFAVDAWAVSDRNRDTRAAVEAGAPVVLTVDASSSLELRRAVLDADPDGAFATPVVTVRSATEVGPRTTAVEPAAFARLAGWAPGDRPTRAELRGITADLPAPITLTGDRVEIDADFSARGVAIPEGAPRPTPAAMRLQLQVVDRQDVARTVELGRLVDGRATYDAPLPCAEGCELRQITIARTFGDFTDAETRLRSVELRVGPAGQEQRVDLAAADANWQSVPFGVQDLPTGEVSSSPRFEWTDLSYGVSVSIQHGAVPVTPTALVVGDVTEAFRPPDTPRRVVAPDLAGRDDAYLVVGRLGRVPRSGLRGVVVDLSAVATGPSAAPALTSYDVWLAANDPVRERRLRADLADRGLQVLARDSEDDHRAALAAEGPTLGLRMAVLAGVAALLLAAAVLVVGVATSGAGRARDLAGLRLVGVPATAIRRASVTEHVVVAALGVVAGSALGLVAAQVALPLVPLFATDAPRLAVDLTPAWTAVLVSVGVALVALVTVAVLVGRGLADSARAERLRDTA